MLLLPILTHYHRKQPKARGGPCTVLQRLPRGFYTIRTMPRRNRQSPGPASGIRQIVRILAGRARAGLLHPSQLWTGPSQPQQPCAALLPSSCSSERHPGTRPADESGKAMASTGRINRTTGPGQASTSPDHTRCQFFILGCPCTVHNTTVQQRIHDPCGRTQAYSTYVLSCCRVHCTAKVQWNIALKQQR